MSVRKLNLVMTYPVKWSEYEVMDNFVQNFYDALGMDQFKDRFNTSFDNGTIIMKSDVGFSKDWLFYIGASTKRSGNKKYAGKFGEGFKIAALVAMRDMNMGVCMESRDWRMNVTEADDTIDGKPVKVLAYDIGERPYEETSVLTLTGATQKHFDELFYQINRFYYEGNGYFERCIAKGENFAVYTAAKAPKESKIFGGLFLNLQRRDSFPIPICFCLHSYIVPGDDRERAILSKPIVIDAIRKVIRYLSPEESMEVLEIYESRWFDHISRTGIGTYDWYTVLSDLIHNIASDRDVLLKFQNKYSSKLIAENNWQWYSAHKKAIAHEWFRQSEYFKRRRVCSLFHHLGIEDLISLCQDNGGFEEESLPDEKQKKRINLLAFLATKYFGKLICYDELPDCRILLNAKSPLAGKAECHKETGKYYNGYGLKVVSRIRTIYILKKYIDGPALGAVLPVYMHELLHQYGGDSSIQFRKALLKMNEIIAENRKEILSFDSKWKAC